MKVFIGLMIAFITVFASKTFVYPVSKTEFLMQGYDKEEIVNMRGKDFIVISLRERGADGRIYAIDRDGTVWLSAVISSGAENFRTPEGTFKVYWKKRFHMSTKYPDESGINNMDFSMFFFKGFAIHLGNINAMSHGCIHVDRPSVQSLFKWANNGTTVIVTRDNYMEFARNNLLGHSDLF